MENKPSILRRLKDAGFPDPPNKELFRWEDKYPERKWEWPDVDYVLDLLPAGYILRKWTATTYLCYDSTCVAPIRPRSDSALLACIEAWLALHEGAESEIAAPVPSREEQTERGLLDLLAI